jgi:hypothetical protein
MATACSANGARGTPVDFVLCSDSPAHRATISIDYKEMYGYVTDTGAPVAKCVGGAGACISWPILIGVPPDLPRNLSDVVRWSVDNDRFAIRLIPGSDDTYFLEAMDFQRVPDGRIAQYGKLLYVYSKDAGIISMRAEGDTPHGWVRCGGRLTFEDLQGLAARIPEKRNPGQ